MVETISREDAAWLAGIIEGEGSFMILRHILTRSITLRSVISVTNTDAKMIQAISEIWYKLGCKFYYGLKKTKGGFALHITAVGIKSVDKIVDLILPYLKTKRDQAELLKEYNSQRSQGRYQRLGIEWYKEMQLKYLDRLHALRINTVDPQRLQRTASQPLKID